MGAQRNIVSTEVRVEAFEPSHLPLVAAFSESYWERPRSASYYSWRYLDAQSFSRMFLARTNDECLGMVYAFRKPYLIGGESVSCSEIFDWHSLPGLSGSGIGVRLMRAMMRQNERLIGLGGTDDAQKALPAMGWQKLGEAVDYELPISEEVLLEGLRQRIRIKLPGEQIMLKALVASRFLPRRRRQLGNVLAVSHSELSRQVGSLYEGETGYDFVQRPSGAWLQWLTAEGQAFGNFQSCLFMVSGQLRGWALTRVYETPRGREGAIVDIFAPQPDRALYRWMVSEAALSVAASGVRLIRARAICPILKAALVSNHFRAGDLVPLFTFPKMPSPPARFHMTLNHTDACLRPYPQGMGQPLASASSAPQ